MPEHQGWRRMSSRYVHGNPGLNTDDPGLTIRDDPCCIREGVKGAYDYPTLTFLHPETYTPPHVITFV